MDPNNQNNNSGTDRDLLNLGNTTGIDISKDNQSNIGIIRKENGQFAEGTIPGPGRPKGKTLKEWRREMLANMTDAERLEFLKTVSNETQWKMTEGNPHQTTDVTSGGEPIQPLFDYVQNRNNNSNEQDTKPDEKN